MAPSVLLVDDNGTIRALAADLLKSAGFASATAADGQSALDLLDSRAFDLLIVDFVMPGIPGDEVVRRVRRHPNPAVRAMPILGLSGSHKDAAELFVLAGVDAYVSKPFKDEPLLAAVKRIIGHPRGRGRGSPEPQASFVTPSVTLG